MFSLNSHKVLFFILTIILSYNLFAKENTNQDILKFDIKISKSKNINSTESNRFKMSLIIKITNDYLKINRDFPIKLTIGKTENNSESNQIIKNEKCKKTYTRNNVKKLSEEEIIIEDYFDFFDEKNNILFSVKGSIGLCSDEFCRKIDINKTFKLNKNIKR